MKVTVGTKYATYTYQELLDLVEYGLNAAKDLRNRDNHIGADAVTKNVCDMMDEIYRRSADLVENGGEA